jgi:hypothetical protein
MQREGSGSHGKHMSGVGTPAAGPERTELGWFLLPTFFRFSNSANTFMTWKKKKKEERKKERKKGRKEGRKEEH